MNTYKVLEAHLGDRPNQPYEPGETRRLMPNEAQALVDLKVLEPMDGNDTSAATAEGVSDADLRAQITALTTERDEARQARDGIHAEADRRVADITAERDAARGEVEHAKAAVTALTTERDEARAEVDRLKAAAAKTPRR